MQGAQNSYSFELDLKDDYYPSVMLYNPNNEAYFDFIQEEVILLQE